MSTSLFSLSCRIQLPCVFLIEISIRMFQFHTNHLHYSMNCFCLNRGPSDHGTTAVVYKSGKRAELVAQGFRIHGSSGDQWSDLIGAPMATRSFKLPNPMYYISWCYSLQVIIWDVLQTSIDGLKISGLYVLYQPTWNKKMFR